MVRFLVVPTRALILATLVLIGSQGRADAGDQPTSFMLPDGLRVRLVPTPTP